MATAASIAGSVETAVAGAGSAAAAAAAADAAAADTGISAIAGVALSG